MLRVLNVAYPFAPVGRDTTGGAEQVVYHLDRGLIEAGHQSYVVAQEGSRVSGILIPVPQTSLDDTGRQRIRDFCRRAIAQCLKENAIDIVHMHGSDFDAYLPDEGVPVLITLHVPCSWYPHKALLPGRPATWLNCVSWSQHALCPKSPRLLQPVENGVPVDELSLPRYAKRSFALALGRICPEKGYHIALEAAQRASRPLLIGGQVYGYDEHRRYFAAEVQPMLDKRRRFLGPLSFERKRRLLSAARCLLVPSLVAETSCLVAMEAMACGTPVVGLPNGAMPEIVHDGETGFLVQDAAEMAEAIDAAGRIDPEKCRKTAARRFSLKPMIARYIELYQSLCRA